MTTNFPSSLDNFTNPASTDLMNSVTVPHNEQHANANDAIEALQAKVGADSSAVTTSHDYKIAQLESAASPSSVLIHTETFSAVSSVSLNGKFTSDYTNYRILARFQNSLAGPQALRVRLRASGTDETANYDTIGFRAFGGGTPVAVESTGYNADVTRYANATNIANGYNFSVIDISGPALTETTLFVAKHVLTEGGTSAVLWNSAWYNDSTTSYDGFTLSIVSGTITGSLSIYGYTS